MIFKIKLPKSMYQVLYLLTFFFFNLFSILNASLISLGFLKKLVYCAVFFVLFILFMTKMRRTSEYLSKFLIYVLISMVFLISGLKTARLNLIIYAFFILDSDIVEFKDIVNMSLISTVLSVLIIYLLCVTDVLKDYIYVHGGGKAHCLGFSYYTYFPYYVFCVFIMYLYLRKKILTWLEIIVLLLGNILLYKLCTVKLTYYLMYVTLLFYVIFVKYRLFEIHNKICKFLSVIAFYVGIIVTFLSMHYYNTDVKMWAALDEKLSWRLYFTNYFYEKYGIKFLGQYIRMEGHSVFETSKYGHYYIDSGFAYSLLGYGLLFSLVVVFLYSTIYYKACEQNDGVLFIWVSIILIFSLVNNVWVSIMYNPILLYSVNELNDYTNKIKVNKILDNRMSTHGQRT